jgi:hypothetical protein
MSIPPWTLLAASNQSGINHNNYVRNYVQNSKGSEGYIIVSKKKGPDIKNMSQPKI